MLCEHRVFYVSGIQSFGKKKKIFRPSVEPNWSPSASLKPLHFHLWEVSREYYLLCLQAKAKEKTYAFRGDAPRGIQVSYPIPEPVITPRAREGLRAVVPTIFPPSAVNRGECVHVQALEPERRPRSTPSAALTVQQPARNPKKRGRKPKLHLHYDKDDGGSSAEPYSKRSRLLEEPETHGLSKMPRHLHHHGETSDHSLMQLTKRFQEETTITPKPYCEQKHAGGARMSYSCAYSPDVRKRDEMARRTGCGMPVHQPRISKHHEEHRRHRVPECCPGPAVVTTQAESIHDSSAPTASSWTPCFANVDTVTVTDVTMNLLTVTVRESSTDKGFFREKRWVCALGLGYCI